MTFQRATLCFHPHTPHFQPETLSFWSEPVEFIKIHSTEAHRCTHAKQNIVVQCFLRSSQPGTNSNSENKPSDVLVDGEISPVSDVQGQENTEIRLLLVLNNRGAHSRGTRPRQTWGKEAPEQEECHWCSIHGHKSFPCACELQIVPGSRFLCPPFTTWVWSYLRETWFLLRSAAGCGVNSQTWWSLWTGCRAVTVLHGAAVLF